MDQNILVTYASKYGSTKKIAEKIGEELRQAGIKTDVLPVSKVQDLQRYTAVILGSAVYVGKWQKEAVAFIKSNERELSGRPVWLFSSGPTGEGDAVELLEGWRVPSALQPVADQIRPRDIAVFHGFIDLDRLSFIDKTMIKAVKKPIGDFRDWEKITAWAARIAVALKEVEPSR